MKNWKIAHFLGQFSNRNNWIWLMKNISWRSAWKNAKMYIRDFGFLKIIAHKFAKLVERFSKMMNLWKIGELPILLAIFGPYMVKYDKQKLSYDNQHWKLKKIHISDFFILETLSHRFVQNILRDFQKHQIMKNTKIDIFIGHFSNPHWEISKNHNSSIWIANFTHDTARFG